MGIYVVLDSKYNFIFINRKSVLQRPVHLLGRAHRVGNIGRELVDSLHVYDGPRAYKGCHRSLELCEGRIGHIIATGSQCREQGCARGRACEIHGVNIFLGPFYNFIFVGAYIYVDEFGVDGRVDNIHKGLHSWA